MNKFGIWVGHLHVEAPVPDIGDAHQPKATVGGFGIQDIRGHAQGTSHVTGRLTAKRRGLGALTWAVGYSAGFLTQLLR